MNNFIELQKIDGKDFILMLVNPDHISAMWEVENNNYKATNILIGDRVYQVDNTMDNIIYQVELTKKSK